MPDKDDKFDKIAKTYPQTIDVIPREIFENQLSNFLRKNFKEGE